MKQVFISYSRQNLTIAERLGRDLDDAGFDVWLDIRKIKGGEQWREAIFEGINQSDVVIVVLSAPAIESEWVRRELLMARSQHKLIIPIMIEATFDLLEKYDETKHLRDVQIIDFINSYERALPLLLRALPGLYTVDPQVDVETIDPATILNPFKGLEAFQQTDADIFFGREDLINKLLSKLQDARRFLAVVGASGSGKSSLVRAGLIPALRRGDLPESEGWPLVIFTPGSEPTKSMAKRLMPVLDERLLPNMMTALGRGPDSLHLITEGLLADAPPTARLVLVVDQFEEVFTRASHNEARRFLELLHTAVTEPDSQTIMILTMRADFFDRLSSFPQLATLFEQENMVIATEMTPENLRRSIEGPAEAVGLVYDHGLSDRILEDIREQPGSLPLLQYALKELYERRDGRRLTLETYEAIGGVRHALAQHAEDTYLEMNAAQQNIMRRILLQLIEVSSAGEPTRRKISRDVFTFRDISTAAVTEVLDQLTAQESRLLITNREIPTEEAHETEPNVWVEISHEALIRNWDRYIGWIAEEEESLRYGGELLKAAQDWVTTDNNPDYLLIGDRLRRAEAWLESADASALQREFINASTARQEQELAEERERERREYEVLQQAAARLRIMIALAVPYTLLVTIVSVVGLIFVANNVSKSIEFKSIGKTSHSYIEGDVAQHDILAPRSITYESGILTQAKREAYIASMRPIYDPPDPAVGSEQLQIARQVLDYIENIRYDDFASLDEKKDDLATITDLTLPEPVAVALLTIDDNSQWRAIDAQITRLLDRVMSGEVRDDNIQAIKDNLPNLISASYSEPEVEIITAIVSDLIRVNTFYNEPLTNQAKLEATANTPLTIQTFDAGEIIVSEGEVITEVHLEALNHVGLNGKRRFGFLEGITDTHEAFVILYSLLFFIGVGVIWRSNRVISNRIHVSRVKVVAIWFALVLVGGLSEISFTHWYAHYTEASPTIPVNEGAAAPYDILSSIAFRYESDVLTQEKRAEALAAAQPVYEPPDETIARDQIQALRDSLDTIQFIRDNPQLTRGQKIVELQQLESYLFEEAQWQNVLDLSDAKWQAIRDQTEDILQKVMAESVSQDNIESIKNSLTEYLSTQYSESESSLIADLAQPFVVENSFINPQLTEQAKADAVATIPVQVRTFAKGQMIIREGEIATAAHIEALDTILPQDESPELHIPIVGLNALFIAATIVSMLFARTLFPQNISGRFIGVCVASLVYLATVQLVLV